MPGIPIPPVDERIYGILAEAGFGDDVFNPQQHRGCELVERYALHHAIDLVGRLGLTEPLASPRTVEELLACHGFGAGFRPALRWLLEHLVAAGLLTREGPRYALPGPLPPPALAELRAEGLANDPSYAPAFALLDEAAAIYPRVARGETSGERALFLRVRLWTAYFSNQNRYYALNNRVAAAAAAARLPRDGGAVLEVGAGLGSATEALIAALRARGTLGALESYDATEPVVFFRRRAEGTLGTAHPGVGLAFSALDINQPWAGQGIEPGRHHLVWGVNVFHLARDLDAVLREALAAVAPGGWLVVGEGVRPFPGHPVGAELPFQILESFVDVRLDPERRPTPGFLTAEQWQGALARAGFSPVETVPDVIRMRALHPGLFAAALCGLRPG